MFLLELTRIFVAIKFARFSFLFLLLLLSCAFGFYFFSHTAYSQLNNFIPKGIFPKSNWYTVEIKNNFGIKGNGFSAIKAQNLMDASEDFIKDWFVSLDNGKSTIKISNKSYEVFPQLYINNAPKKLQLSLFKGRLPQENSKEVIISYEFWLRQLKAPGDLINNYIEKDGAKFLIVGITQPNFQSFFQNLKYDIFVNAKQWISTQEQAQMFWQIITFARPINLAINASKQLKEKQIFSRLQIIAQNLHIDDNSSLRIFSGLVDDIKQIKFQVEFSKFYYYLSLAIAVLALLAFLIYQSLSIIKQKKDFHTRWFLGEGDFYLFLNQFVYVFFWLVVAIVLGFIFYYSSLILFKNSSLIKFLLHHYSIKKYFHAFYHLIFASLLVAISLAYFVLVVIKKETTLMKNIFIVIISIIIILLLSLASITWVNKLQLQHRFNQRINFQPKSIYQWYYTKNESNPSQSPSVKELKQLLIMNLNTIKGIDDILISTITPIHGYNLTASQEIEENGSFTTKTQYFANVPANYFNFYKIPVLSGKIPQHLNSKSNVIVNKILADKYGGVQTALNKKTESGENIIAVVEDAHFLTSDMKTPPFTYYINDKLQDIFISIKGKFDVNYVHNTINKIMVQHYKQYKLESKNTFIQEFKNYFTTDFNRLKLLSILTITVFTVGLFSLYAGTIQWLEINRKNIAIRFALGLREKLYWRELILKTFLWLLLMGFITLILLYFVAPKILIDTNLLLLFSVLSFTVIVSILVVAVIYWVIFNRLPANFLANSL